MTKREYKTSPSQARASRNWHYQRQSPIPLVPDDQRIMPDDTVGLRELLYHKSWCKCLVCAEFQIRPAIKRYKHRHQIPDVLLQHFDVRQLPLPCPQQQLLQDAGILE